MCDLDVSCFGGVVRARRMGGDTRKESIDNSLRVFAEIGPEIVA